MNAEDNKKIVNRIKKIVFIFFIIIIYNIILIFISSMDSLTSATFFKAYIITTESMQPEFKKDDMIIVHNVKFDNLKKGDIITYAYSGDVITHRILDINTETGELVTKGDNNEVEDNYNIKYENIIGKKVIKIPGIGKIIGWLKNVIIVVLIMLIVLVFLLFRMEQDEKSRRRRIKKKNEIEKRKNYTPFE